MPRIFTNHDVQLNIMQQAIWKLIDAHALLAGLPKTNSQEIVRLTIRQLECDMAKLQGEMNETEI